MTQGTNFSIDRSVGVIHSRRNQTNFTQMLRVYVHARPDDRDLITHTSGYCCGCFVHLTAVVDSGTSAQY